MTKHVFGNGPSPAVASYGLRKTAKDAETDYGSDFYDFVQNNFYVYDGLISVSTPAKAVSLLTRTQAALATGHIRLHKICSNSQEVLDNFPSEDLAQDLKDLNLGDDDIPSQRSLGLCWRLHTDAFFFKVYDTPKPYTRRGVLSTINSLYDPLGFLAPVIIQGRVLLRDMVAGTVDWDEPLSETQRVKWETWEKSLLHLHSFSIPRRTPISKGDLTNEVHIFADASERAIAAVAYLTLNNNGETYTTFLLGKSKVAPKHGNSIPRLELCGALLAVEVGEILSEQLSLPPEQMTFYSDSKVVLGYLNNRTRRFYVYVANRVSRILRFSKPEQWFYVASESNPADEGTRFVPASQLKDSMWISGPPQLFLRSTLKEESFSLVEPSQDENVRPEVVAMKTQISPTSVTDLIHKHSDWMKLIRAVSRVILTAERFKNLQRKVKPDEYQKPQGLLHAAEVFIIKEVQKQADSREVDVLGQGKPLPKTVLY
ncbi:uncharacterized protein [Argopecten irradians]|uniref:uncharacterized protein n=1 Tax=Argopecten irradians TaxID=31199 RepID=UPI00371D4AF4